MNAFYLRKKKFMALMKKKKLFLEEIVAADGLKGDFYLELANTGEVTTSTERIDLINEKKVFLFGNYWKNFPLKLADSTKI